MTDLNVHTAVQTKCGAIATSVGHASGCGPLACCGDAGDPITSDLCSSAETVEVPQ